MKEDIIGGLKNALERGATLQEAIDTFLSAGYNPQEVQEAAREISQGAVSTVPPQSQSQIQRIQPQKPQSSQIPSTQKPSVPQTQSSQPPQRLQTQPQLNKPQQSPAQSPPQQLKPIPSQPIQQRPLAPVSPPQGKPMIQKSFNPTPPVRTPVQAFPVVQPKPNIIQPNIVLNDENVKGSSNTKLIILISIVLILVAAVIIGLIFSNPIISYFDSLFSS